jgi:hypothetical protein
LRPLQIYPLTISLNPLPALKTGCLGAFMLIVSPVRGLRPSLAFASVTPNVPKPSKRISPPALSVAAAHQEKT